MTESTLSLTYDDLLLEVGFYLGYGRVAGDYTIAQKELIDSIVRSGLSQFYTPPLLPGQKIAHEWSFLKPVAAFDFTAPYETGTVTIVNGVATLAGGSWPTWAADGELEIDGTSYPVTSRQSTSQITLDDLTLDANAGTAYSLGRLAYTLPDDFGSPMGDWTLDPGNAVYVSIKLIDEFSIRQYQQQPSVMISGQPLYVAIRPQALLVATTGQRWEVICWPVADAAYRANYRYRVLPNTLASADYPYGGASHRETILESCLAVAERRMEDEEGVHTAAFHRLLTASISVDQRLEPDRLGYCGDPSMATYRGIPFNRTRQVTYNGVLYGGD